MATKKTNIISNAFDKALGLFIKLTDSGMDAARQCAMLSLAHFQEHGDLSQCQRFLDAMGENRKNYVRRTAYLKWLIAHAPVVLTSNKLTKDKVRGDDAFNLEAAFKISFWDYSPEALVVNLGVDDAFKRIFSALNYFDKENVKVSPAIHAAVASIKTLVGKKQVEARKAEAKALIAA